MRHGTANEVGSSKGANNSQDPGHSYVAVELENAQHVTQLALTRILSLSLSSNSQRHMPILWINPCQWKVFEDIQQFRGYQTCYYKFYVFLLSTLAHVSETPTSQ